MNQTNSNRDVGGADNSMNIATRAMVREWVEMYRGNVDAVARYMSRELRIGGMKACRALVGEAMA